jgi:uncharacterized protein YdhG (YjbR/CyaY superfamily)
VWWSGKRVTIFVDFRGVKSSPKVNREGGGNGPVLDEMPPPKRADIDEYYAKLPDVAVPRLKRLRQLCRTGMPKADEVLHRNFPAFVQDGTRLVMLQSFKQHCSLRLPPRLFATQRKAVEQAGYETGDGFIKLPNDRGLPIALLKQLIKARLEEFKATGAGW